MNIFNNKNEKYGQRNQSLTDERGHTCNNREERNGLYEEVEDENSRSFQRAGLKFRPFKTFERKRSNSIKNGCCTKHFL